MTAYSTASFAEQRIMAKNQKAIFVYEITQNIIPNPGGDEAMFGTIVEDAASIMLIRWQSEQRQLAKEDGTYEQFCETSRFGRANFFGTWEAHQKRDKST